MGAPFQFVGRVTALVGKKLRCKYFGIRSQNRWRSTQRSFGTTWLALQFKEPAHLKKLRTSYAATRVLTVGSLQPEDPDHEKWKWLHKSYNAMFSET